MKRILFVSSLGIGHAFPMVPLARALQAAGHEVLLATTGEALVTAQAGIPVHDVAPGMTRAQLMARVGEVDPEQVRALLAARSRDLAEAAVPLSVMVRVLVDGVVALARDFRPDLVVQSQGQGAGLVTAGALGVPLAEHNFGLIRATGLDARLRELLGDVFEQYTAELPEHRTTLDVAPSSMVDSQAGWPLRYVPYNGTAVIPNFLTTQPSRPRIAVTLGTVAPGTSGLGPVRHLLELASRVDAEFVLALGKSDLGELEPLPPNVRVGGWLPLNRLLPTCAAVVHHGGAGSTMTALAAGVPQLVLPSGADRYVNADAVHARGAGLAADQPSLDLLCRLLTDDGIRVAAQEVRAEIQAMPSPELVARRLLEQC
ncbi:UDP:flavonoid glycosyltransferase YjiC (YdhE family) [Crossiella equi]|uniref:UDP:flavonoid glycosyltransferase YjiC (YdhE family) n=1 Tax=Crossiella equi TaxID=130796 RepID=A0ABS5A673_9PSEU|nr:nucleotide disphospho-sugar-binding domain-containing protein [Crossiella equi]MBP2472098.1 UDP:flavonoid glycosyltransferase YjiC (YdhE family) [Crossiella equi]